MRNAKKPSLKDVDANNYSGPEVPVVVFHAGSSFPIPETGEIISVDEDDLAFAAVMTTDGCEPGTVRLGWQMSYGSEGGGTLDGWPRLELDGGDGETWITADAAEALVAAADQILLGEKALWSAPLR